MTTMSPLQRVKKEYGTKEKLVEKVAGGLEKKEGESKDVFKKRLLTISSKKLLNLASRAKK